MALTKPAGTWTYDDLFSLPDDGKRYEIIEGELYEMPGPEAVHAVVIANLITLLIPLATTLGGRWFTAPLDVFFAGANPVQPDILVLLPGGLAHIERRGIEGVPDLVIEVLSPSNHGHDLLTKRALYARGAREYWIVDPAARTVEVLALDRDAFHRAQLASGDDSVASPLLSGATFPLAEVFAGIHAESADN